MSVKVPKIKLEKYPAYSAIISRVFKQVNNWDWSKKYKVSAEVKYSLTKISVTFLIKSTRKIWLANEPYGICNQRIIINDDETAGS